MPLDPSIALQYRLPQIDNPIQAGAQAMTLRNAMFQGDIAQRGIADDTTLREVLSQSGGDLKEAQSGLMQRGLYKPAMEIGKGLREQNLQESTINKNNAETLAKNLETVRDMLVPVNDEQTFQAWRSNAVSLMPQSDKTLPRQFSPEVKKDILMKSDEMLKRLSPQLHFTDTGGAVQPTNPYTGAPQGAALPKTVSPDTAARVANAPDAPVTAVTVQDPKDPNATIIIDGRTGKVLGKGPKFTDAGKLEAKRQFNMQGIGATIQAAEDILTGRGGDPMPTGSGFGTAVDYAASLVGASPEGSKQADQMRALGGALVAKMPRMEGPQSDKDVALYRESAGRIGDSTIPIARRKAALETVKGLWAKYERLNPEAFAGGGAPGGGGMPSADAIDAELARRRSGL